MFHAGIIPTKDQVQFGDFWNGLGILEIQQTYRINKKTEEQGKNLPGAY